MNRILLILLFLIPIGVSCQVRPDQSPIEENPDTSNFEVYGQKGGVLKRTTLDRLGGYLFDNLTIEYVESLNRIYLSEYGVRKDSIDLADAAVTASLADTTLTINSQDINLSSFDNSFQWFPASSTLILNRAGTNDTISLATLAADLEYDNPSLSLVLGTDSVDVSQLRQELSYNSGTNVLTLSNGGGSVTIDAAGGSGAITTASYFSGDGTAGDPLTIDDNGITFTKLQQVNSGSILGRYSTSVGVVEQLSIGSGINVSPSGVISVDLSSLDTIVFSSENSIDSTFVSDGTDLASTYFEGILTNFDVLNLDLTLEAAAASNLIASLPSAFTYRNKDIFITNVVLSDDYSTIISNVSNADVASQYKMRNGEALHLRSIKIGGNYSWVAVSSSESYIRRYSAGSGVYVTADNLGITASKSAGQVTISIPSNATITSFRFFGTAGDLNSGEITFDFVGGKGSGVDYNTADTNMYHPFISIQQRTVAPATDFEQRPYDVGSFQIFNEVFSNSGTVSVKITNLSGSFGVFGQF